MTNLSVSDALQRAIKPVSLPVAASLVVIWTGAWLLHLEKFDVLAASLTVIVLGLAVVKIRIVLERKYERGGESPGRGGKTFTGPAGLQSPHAGRDIAGDQPIANLNGRRWSLDVFAAIDAQRFAAVCETWFSWAGFDTRSEAHRTDEGVDIWLHAARMPGPVAIVRCKHWRNKPVGLQDMKEFLGLVANFQSAHGTYTTTSTYTPEALQFAKENGIDAVDGRGLLRRIQTRTRQRQQALLAVAYSGQ